MPSAWLLLAALSLQSPNTLYDRAWSAFEKGDVRESVRLFDQLVQVAPGSEPDLWQRGIAQYEAGQFKACKAQFELHRQVNPNDVENAAFHFLCTAGAEGPEAARKQLLPVGPDARVPMREVYLLFAGRAKPEAVIQAAGARPDAVDRQPLAHDRREVHGPSLDREATRGDRREVEHVVDEVEKVLS